VKAFQMPTFCRQLTGEVSFYKDRSCLILADFGRELKRPISCPPLNRSKVGTLKTKNLLAIAGSAATSTS
jgi:hypothetical protein